MVKKSATAFVIFVLFYGFTLTADMSYAENILMAIDDYPPYHIFHKDGSKPTGLNILIVEKVIARVNQESDFNLNLTFTKNTPFKRCLIMMANGEADIVCGLLNRDDRATYMHMLEYKGKSPKIFYVKKKREH